MKLNLEAEVSAISNAHALTHYVLEVTQFLMFLRSVVLILRSLILYGQMIHCRIQFSSSYNIKVYLKFINNNISNLHSCQFFKVIWHLFCSLQVFQLLKCTYTTCRWKSFKTYKARKRIWAFLFTLPRICQYNIIYRLAALCSCFLLLQTEQRLFD